MLFAGVGDVSERVFTGVLLDAGGCAQNSERRKGVGVSCVPVVELEPDEWGGDVAECNDCSSRVAGTEVYSGIGRPIYRGEAVRGLVEDTDADYAEIDAGELAVESWVLGGGLRFGGRSRHSYQQAK